MVEGEAIGRSGGGDGGLIHMHILRYGRDTVGCMDQVFVVRQVCEN